jgi:hypothetical protein
MKKLKVLVVGLFLIVTASMQSQVSVNLNVGTPPSWGPAGYSNVDYYYLPDVESYYDIRASQFIYFGQGKWIRARNLPGRYRNYDLYNGYKVVLNDYHGRAPYSLYKQHKVKYYKGYKGKPQKSIGRAKSHENFKTGSSNKSNSSKGNASGGKANKGHKQGKH